MNKLTSAEAIVRHLDALRANRLSDIMDVDTLLDELIKHIEHDLDEMLVNRILAVPRYLGAAVWPAWVA